MALAVLVLALLMPAALATQTNCLNATLPNILDLSSCIGTSLDLCTATVGDIVKALVKVVTVLLWFEKVEFLATILITKTTGECLGNLLCKLTATGALSALVDIINVVLGILGLNLGVLTGLISPLCCVSNVPGCKTILSSKDICKEPIVLTLPGELNLGKCLTNTLLLCKNGSVATDQLLVNLIKALACLLKTLISTDPTKLISILASAVITLLQTIASTVSLALKTPLLALCATIKLSCGC